MTAPRCHLAIIGIGLVAITAATRASAPTPAAGRHLTLLITGQNNGVFEPCGCKGMFRGGLVRRATFFESARTQHPNVIALDTGDQTDTFSILDEFGPRREIRNRTDRAIINGMVQLRYGAVLVGDRDLAWGVDRYRSVYGELPMVATNVSANGAPLGERLRVVDTPAGRVAIIGVIAPEALALLNPRTRLRLNVADPIDAANSTLAGVDAEVVIALTLGGPAFESDLAERVPRIDVIVSQPGHGSGRTYDGDAIRIESPQNGLSVATLELSIADDGTVSEVDRTATLIEPSIPAEPHLGDVFSALNYTVGRLQLIEDADFPRGRQHPADACGECHQSIYEWWTQHPHAKAFDAIAAEGRVEDANCLPCHVSGFEEAGGYRNLIDTPKLVGVTCTMCHNVDLAAHTAADTPNVPRTPRDACLMCHTRQDSPRFEKEEAAYIDAATCPSED